MRAVGPHGQGIEKGFATRPSGRCGNAPINSQTGSSKFAAVLKRHLACLAGAVRVGIGETPPDWAADLLSRNLVATRTEPALRFLRVRGWKHKPFFALRGEVLILASRYLPAN